MTIAAADIQGRAGFVNPPTTAQVEELNLACLAAVAWLTPYVDPAYVNDALFIEAAKRKAVRLYKTSKDAPLGWTAVDTGGAMYASDDRDILALVASIRKVIFA